MLVWRVVSRPLPPLGGGNLPKKQGINWGKIFLACFWDDHLISLDYPSFMQFMVRFLSGNSALPRICTLSQQETANVDSVMDPAPVPNIVGRPLWWSSPHSDQHSLWGPWNPHTSWLSYHLHWFHPNLLCDVLCYLRLLIESQAMLLAAPLGLQQQMWQFHHLPKEWKLPCPVFPSSLALDIQGLTSKNGLWTKPSDDSTKNRIKKTGGDSKKRGDEIKQT